MNVLVEKQKLDILANAISNKSGEPVTMTLAEMVEAVDGIEAASEPILQAKTYTVDSAGTETITADSGYDGLSEVEVEVPNAIPCMVIEDEGYETRGNRRHWMVRGKLIIDSSDENPAGYIEDGTYYGSSFSYFAIASGTSVTPTESSQTIGGANTMMEGAVTVNAIPSNYVGSGITQRSSSDLTASGATVTVPSGYYSSQASKSVSNGTAGTPTATKGTVSNHSVSVTPSVTNTTGWITGSTINGTAVSVSASELVSGTYTVSASGSHDVTNYASASVASGTATASATKGTVSNHSVTVTPSVTRTAGYITAGSASGTAVTVSASELVSGSDTVTTNDTYDVTNLAEIVVNVPSGGGSVTVTDEANATGITCVITSGGGPVPPTPTGWETVWEGNASAQADTPYNYFWISDLGDVYPTVGSVWRITVDGTPYVCTAYSFTMEYYNLVGVGNPKYSGGTDDGTSAPFNFYNAGWGAWAGDTELSSTHSIKVERQVSE